MFNLRFCHPFSFIQNGTITSQQCRKRPRAARFFFRRIAAFLFILCLFYPLTLLAIAPPGAIYVMAFHPSQDPSGFSTRSYDALVREAERRTIERAERDIASYDPTQITVTWDGSVSCTDNNNNTLYCFYEATCTAWHGGTFSCNGASTYFYSGWLDSILDEEKNSGCDDNMKGNPCNPATGNKYQKEVDYTGSEHVPNFVRYYNSRGYSAFSDNKLAPSWNHNHQRSIELDSSGVLVGITRADGKKYYFVLNNNVWVSDSDINDTLEKTNTGWKYTRGNASVENYDNNGRLLSETDANSLTTTYEYTAEQLTGIIGPYGHRLTLGYDPDGRLHTVTDPINQAIVYTYQDNNLAMVSYPDNTGKRYHYEDPNFPHYLTGISIIDVGGVETRYATFGYDGNGKAILTQHAQTDHAVPQEKFTISYPSYQQTPVTDAAGQIEVLNYANILGVKNLISKVNQTDGKASHYTYDPNNNRTCHQDAEGSVTTYTYNPANQRIGLTEGQSGDCTTPTTTPESRTTRYTYLSPDIDLIRFVRRPSVLTGSEAVTEIKYEDPAHPTLATSMIQTGFKPDGSPVSRSVSMTYNANGQMIRIDGPRTDVNDVTTLDYYTCTTGSECGQLSSVTNALGHTTTYDFYYPDGRVKQTSDPNDLVTTYAYDARGRIATLTQTPVGGTARVTQYTYTAFNAIETLTSPDGNTLTYTYDAAQDLRAITDNLGNKIEYDYDSRGNRTTTRVKDPDGTLVRQIEQSFNHRNYLETITAGGTGGSLTTLITDAVGTLISETDPNNNADGSLDSTTHTPDPLNRLIKTVDQLSGITDYDYDVQDNLTQVQAPNGATTDYVNDDLGNLLQETSPDRGTITYTHDAAGNVTTIIDARGVTVSYTYDALNRVTLIDYPGTAEDVTFTYDLCAVGAGRLCAIQDQSGTTTYSYDGFGNITAQVHVELGVTYTTQYTYDAGDRVTAITYPDGRVATYSRDAIGRITGVSMTVNDAPTAIVTGLTYRADGLLTGQTYGHGLQETRGYDLQGRLLTQSLGPIDTRVYGHDANGNLTGKQTLAEVASYTYDALDRLSGDNATLSASSLTYDANGNRLTRLQDGETFTYHYTPASNRLEQVVTPLETKAVVLDAAGNTVSDRNGNRTFTYNSAGRLTQFFDRGALKASYTYNAAGQRTRKRKETATAPAITVFHYDLAGRLLAETREDGTLRRAYLWADDRPLAQIRRKNNGTDVLLYLHADHLNTPRAATDPTQNVVWRWEGRAFGNTKADQDPDGDGKKTQVRLRFPGQFFDGESGLRYNWNRYYDAQKGRYITSDPIGLRGGLNTYLYANANPGKFVDPDGLSGIIVLPRPIIIPRPIPMPAQPIDPALPLPIPDTTTDEGAKDYCTRLYVRCVQDGWGGDWSCGQCQFFCTGMNEVWPFEHCSPDFTACR